ncbi:MAG: thiol peroxidase [Anaerolineae bacterium]|jgi:thiol peroxidase|nr:Thiol peroxidase [Anaerolineales bacterium]MBW7919301.1 thiol peroxidase [Anaerolineales bacterium]MCC7512824.1 thiol peroxidase [Anaerolineae bacterium]MCZ2289012.1 thiol peroxidase [Anaerolineales bacterium]OQY86361.1 MAG: lipid hydroperoxide peroxidase [Anaerolineae bacterium UTCFX3]
MTTERFGIIKVGGRDATVIGDDVKVGDAAPEFTVHALDWSLTRGLADTKGKVRIIAAVPSLDTDVCDRETRRFNQEAAALDKDIVIQTVSTDLPYAQKRWCGAAGVDQVMVLSDHQNAEFGEKYGVLIKERRILRRAVFVVGRDDKIVYAAYMPALGDEPNYEEVIEAAKKALQA